MSNSSNESSKKKGLVGAIGFAVVLFTGLILLFMSYKKIPTGYVGVVYNMNGGVTGKVLGEGGHFLKPAERVSKFLIGIEQSYLTATSDGDSKEDDSFEVPSKDGKALTVDLTFTYRFDPDRVADTFKRFHGMNGKEIKNTFIKPSVMTWTKEITAKRSVTDIIGDQRSAINEELSAYLKEKFDSYGIIIETASLINVDPDKETRKAIQAKVNAQQEKELAQVQAETAKINAEKDKQVAEIAAETSITKANADAEVKRIEAEAEAEANRKIAASLSEELVEKIKYEKWNGKLPTVQGNDSTIIDMRSNSKEK